MRQIRVFVASPGDVHRERGQLGRVTDEINRTHGARDNFHLELVKWETHSYPEMGSRAQPIINRQIGEYDIFVGILWGRYGTPTDEAESGTEEEFDRAYAAKKEGRVQHILFYFCDAPLHLAALSTEQWKQTGKVLEFRSRLKNEGLFWTYPSNEEFADTVRPHLIKVVYEEILKQAPIRGLEKISSHAPSKPYVIGVDIGSRKIAAAVIQLGRLKTPEDRDIYWDELPAGAVGSHATILNKVYDHITTTVNNSGVSWDKIEGIGLGVPGQVDVKTGTLRFSPGLKVENVPFRQKLGGHFREMAGDTLEVRVDNDARCAARCELYLGLGKTLGEKRSDFVVIFIGAGVGSGIVVDGRVYYGAKSCAGEIGHTKISQQGPPCNCGAIGCLETFVTGPAIVRIAKERALTYTRGPGNTLLSEFGERLNELHIADALRHRDEAALEVAKEVGELLGQGIANYANVFNPELVILGGGVIFGFYNYFSNHIRRGFDSQALRDVRDTTIVPSDFERFGPVIGAALLFHRDDAPAAMH